MKTPLYIACAATLLLSVYHRSSIGAETNTTAIEIKSFAFVPQELTVVTGTTVTWTNTDQTAHSVIAKNGGFSSKGMDTDDRYSFTFTQEGDYAYFCSLHPHMTGTIHVRAH